MKPLPLRQSPRASAPLTSAGFPRLAWRFLVLCLILATLPVAADVYIYRGPDGERLLSDKPVLTSAHQYTLLRHRRTLKNAGHILANRQVKAETRRNSAADYRNFIEDASQQYQIDPLLVEAVIQIESGFNPNAVSRKGATGLMQLMKDTASQYQVSDRFDPRKNIGAGVQHLRYLMDRYNGQIPLVLAAYNAGAGNVDKYHGIPPFPETRRYVKKVLEHQIQLRATNLNSLGIVGAGGR